MVFWLKTIWALIFALVIGAIYFAIWFFFLKPPLLVVLNCSASAFMTNPGTDVTWTVDVTGGVPPYQFSWSSNSGLNSQATSATYAFRQNGYYGVEVVVRDQAQQAVIKQCPSLTVSNLYYSGCSSDPIGTSTVSTTIVWIPSYKYGEDPLSFTWQGSDGLKSDTATSSITYGSPGLKKAVGCITDSLGRQICRECQINIQ